MSKIIGYNIHGYDNDSYMFKDFKKTCPKCGFRNNFDEINQNFKVKVKKYDFSTTYEGKVIVSDNFKKFCIDNKYKGVNFFPIHNEKNFFIMNVENIIQYNKDYLEYGEYCTKCKHYEAVVTGMFDGIYLCQDKEIDDNFYKTDINLGSENFKSPLLIIGQKTMEKIKLLKLKGIFFDNVYTQKG